MITQAEILKARILIVDDQAANVTLLEQMLQEAGYVSISSTRNPCEASDLYQEHHYDLILLDLKMPGMDGFEVMEDLKKVETGGYLPVLVITAQPGEKLHALKAGARDFISKPFDLAEVLARVRNLLEVRLLHLETQRLYDQVVAEQQASEKLLHVFRSGPMVVSIHSIADGRIIDANAEHCRFSGYSREEIADGRITDPDLWADPEDRLLVLDRLLNEGAMRGFETRRRGKSGEVRDVLASLELIELPGENGPVCISMFIDITERKQTEADLKKTHRILVETSRLAGMAEVATGVLHNVGNVLNSVNVTSSCLAENLRKSKTSSLTKVAALLGEHAGDLGAFLTGDERGRQLPGYLGKLAEHLADERDSALVELAQLQKNIGHIKNIVCMQQNFAKVAGHTETLFVADLLEEALVIGASSPCRNELAVTRDFGNVPLVTVERHKVLQILVNLMSNAQQACDEPEPPEKRLTLRLSHDSGRVRIAVGDNGVGIPAENLTRIFAHGFTTKTAGHGFGLHNSALDATSMGGSLSVHSDGPGRGATFTLELPVTPFARNFDGTTGEAGES